MLNIAGPEYDFDRVLFVVLEDCEHRRRGFEPAELEAELEKSARARLAKIRAAYDEFGGAPAYWRALEAEVLETALPQYVHAARLMNALENDDFGVWRRGDPAARIVFALGGLLLGSIIIALPFVPVFEAMFAFALAAAGFLYPELKRYTHERRHYRTLNRLVVDAGRFQRSERLQYMTTSEIRDSFALADPLASSRVRETSAESGDLQEKSKILPETEDQGS
jgi:hypothetical protein